jgi:hypothetical protein
MERRHDELIAATVEEVAATLSFQEGRKVTVNEVRALEYRAIMKLRRELIIRGLAAEDLLPASMVRK